jgi:hypothetical protein
MKIKTSELTGAALDWAVAKASDLPYPLVYDEQGEAVSVSPSTNWSQGGPLLEREGISVMRIADRLPHQQWEAGEEGDTETEFWGIVCGPTPLIAAMRCFVASRLGDEVDVPDELAMDALIYDTTPYEEQ